MSNRSITTTSTNVCQMERGVPEDRIIFLNLISAPEGIAKFKELFPRLRGKYRLRLTRAELIGVVVTAFIDQKLNEKNYIVPGLGMGPIDT